MKMKEGFILRKVGTQYVVAATGRASENFNGIIRLNESGAFAFRQLQAGVTVEELVARLLDYEGFMLGVNGVVTFKKSTVGEALQAVPLDRVVVETDAPYLAPVPHRGKRNESAYVVEVAARLAQVYRVPLEEVTRRTTQNALKVFKIEG